jgi:hypothetical protein
MKDIANDSAVPAPRSTRGRLIFLYYTCKKGVPQCKHNMSVVTGESGYVMAYFGWVFVGLVIAIVVFKALDFLGLIGSAQKDAGAFLLGYAKRSLEASVRFTPFFEMLLGAFLALFVHASFGYVSLGMLMLGWLFIPIVKWLYGILFVWALKFRYPSAAHTFMLPNRLTDRCGTPFVSTSSGIAETGGYLLPASSYAALVTYAPIMYAWTAWRTGSTTEQTAVVGGVLGFSGLLNMFIRWKLFDCDSGIETLLGMCFGTIAAGIHMIIEDKMVTASTIAWADGATPLTSSKSPAGTGTCPHAGDSDVVTYEIYDSQGSKLGELS